MGWSILIAYLFPGQGSQYVGMGQEFYREFRVARKTFLSANEFLGYRLDQLCFEGPKEKLNQTKFSQVAILTTSIACYRVIEEVGRFSPPAAVAGHSLGEYSALVAAKSIDFITALSLVKQRSDLMEEVALQVKGGMAAILGLREEEIEEICREVGEGLEIANINSPDQIVITGREDSLLRGIKIATEKGAKRVVRLSVSGPFHSSYLKEAGLRLAKILEEVEFKPPYIPVVANVSADYVKEPDQIKESLSRQIFSKVRWEEGMRRLIREGFRNFVEVGPGKVLSGLLRRIDKGVKVWSIETPEDLVKNILLE